MDKVFAGLLVLTLGGIAWAQNLSGTYELNPNQTVAVVESSRSMKFDIGGSAGNDEFTLKGTAKLVRKNVFEYRTIVRGKVEDSVCRIRFTFSGRYLTVKEDLECTNYRFPDISLNGRYEKVVE